MNRCYCLVWNRTRQLFVVASEISRGRGKAGRTSRTSRLAWLAVLPLSLSPALSMATAMSGVIAPAVQTPRSALPIGASASPSGGHVTAGSGHISRSGLTTTIDQQSQNLSLNWQSFNIGADSTVNFVQPNAQAIAVNRIADANGSVILGRLNANGQVFLINPNGVLFGRSAQVNVGGLVASTLDVSDSKLGRGTLHFGGAGRGSVANRGTITAAPGGYVALLGPTVSNQGAIHAPAGSVALAAGSAVTLNFDGSQLLDMQIDASTLNALAENRQLIVADGGQVLMSAGAKDSLLASVVNNTGTIQARTVENRAGKIVLLGGMAAGTTHVDGTLDASAPNGGDGGFIETSAAHVQVADGAKISTLAAAGNTGTWLIDPTDFTIAASGGDITGAALGAALGSGNVTIESANGGTSGSGDIRVNDSVSWGGNLLTLSAYNDIYVDRPLNASGPAGLALAYGQGAVAAGNTSTYHVNAPVNLSADGSFSTRLGSDGAAVDYTIITGLGDIDNPSPADLLMLSVSYNGYFVLGADIDASATASWVGGGFVPVPDFMGTFDGLGHTITSLTINRPGKNAVGLFGLTEDSAIVRNVGMVGGAITGNGSVGSLVGSNYGTITNAYATGAVTNVAPANTLGAAGGLVGSNNGSITNAYATGAVTSGGYAVGGLVGLNFGTVTNAYATGTASSGSFGASGGGLVGVNGGTITNAYWDTDTATQTATAGVTGLTTQQLIASLPAGFDPAIWGNSDNQTTPYMLGRTGNQVFTHNDLPSPTGAHLYTVILDLNHLQAVQANLGDRYVLGNAIDASDTSGLNGGAGFVPLGTDSAGSVLNGGGGFTGTFDGLGYAITDLSVHRANQVGLFGYAGNGSILRNVSLLGGVMAGSDHVGGLVGQNIGGTITHVYTTNAVTGNDYVGGLVGSNNGTITDAYATGAVTGINYVGGLVGEDDGGTITHVYATNVVSGSYFVGGLIGSSNSTITDAYATGAVTGSDYVGGLMGKDDGGTITNVHATGTVIGTNNYVGGLVGLNNSTIDNAYATGAVTGNDRVGGLVGSNNSTITHAHTTGTVNGNSVVGGLVGSNSGTITHAFATGAITGATHVGGLVGDNTGLVGDNSAPVDDDEPIIDTYATGVVTGSDYVGGLVGYNRALVGDSDSGTIARAYAAGVVMGGDHAGGLVGGNDGGAITNAYATGAVTGSAYVGGLAGESNGAITDAYATGTVTGDGNYVGGLVGNDDGGTADIVYATGTVTGGDYVGGLMGRNDATITHAYATGAATGGKYVGGLMGSNSGAISYAYAKGAATGGDYVGGLVGSNDGAISYTYATGAVTTETRGGVPAGYRVGGLVGYNDNHSDNIHYSYWDTETTGQGMAIGALGSGGYYSFDVTGESTTAMMQASTFAGWNVDTAGGGATAWRIYAGHTLPLLKAFLAPVTVTFDPYVIVTTYNGQAFHGAGLVHPLTDTDMNRLWFSSDDGSPVRNAGSYDLSGQDLYSDQQGYDIVVSGGGSGFLYINRAFLTLAAVTDSRAYDGTTTSSGTATVTGLLGSDAVTNLSQNFASKNVLGTNGSTLAVNSGYAIDDGNGGNNYAVNFATATGTITPVTLTLGGLSADDKVYDATTTATATGSVFGVLGSDDVNAALVASFADKNVGTSKTVTVDGITLGGTDGGNYVIAAGQTTTAGITAAILTLGNLSAADRVYDTTTAATATGSLFGVFGSDDVDAALAASFADKNADTGKTVTVDGITLGGIDAGNYVITAGQTTMADITPATLTLGGLFADDKVYDATTTATATGSLFGVLGSDDVDAALAANFADKNVGTAKTVTVVGTLSGTDADNYVIADDQTTTANISTRAITVDATGTGRVYDGSTIDSVSLASAGLLGGDVVDFSGTGAFADKKVGTGKTVSVTGIAASGTDAGNYSFNATAATTADITAKAITVDATGVDKVYDGSTVATIAALGTTGLVAGDVVTFGNTSAAFGDKNAGTGKMVTVSGIAASGTDAGNYSFSTTTNTTADISQLGITVGATGTNKVYDGNTVDAVALVSAGVLSGDTVNFTGSGSFTDKSAGTGKTVNVSGISAGGADAGNYSFNATANTTADISQLGITVDATGMNKVYDGSTADAVALASVGVLSGDTVNFTGTGSFADKNVGTAKAVGVSGIAASGSDAGNYSFNTIANTTANITAKTITVGATGVDKVYDGSAAAAITALGTTGLVAGDVVTFGNTSAAFDNKNAGTGKTVTVSGIAASGANAGNYSFNTAATTTADVTALGVTVDATGTNRVYDGTTADAVALASAGVLSGDTVSFTGTGSFADKHVGTGKTVSVSGIAASGSDAGNYSFNTTATTTADIAAKAITVDATGVDKVYDGSTSATIATLGTTGLVAGDVVTFGNTSAAFDDKHAGTGKTVTVSGIVASGTDAGNYSFNTATNTTADISQLGITVDATGTNKVYDGSSADAIALASAGVLSGDTMSFTGTGSFADKNVGTAKAVSVSGIAASGSDAGNYSFNTIANTTADITAKTITVDATAVDKVYDGSTDATALLAGAGVIVGDEIDFGGSASFADKNAGAGKTVTVNGIAASGSDANNYSFNATANTTADITAKTITVNATGVDKVYDGGTVATIAALDTMGLVAGDVITFDNASAAFDDKNVGTGKTVMVSGIAASGTDAGNYSFNTTANTTADIGQLGITVGATASDKVYDATTGTVVVLGSSGVLAGDNVAFSGTGSFADKNAGTNKAVTVSDIAADGADAGNYSFNTHASDTANIRRLGITVGGIANDKIYDATTNAAVSLGSSGVLAGDTVTFDGTGSFADKNAGTAKAVGVSGIVASGTDANNYSFNTTANTTADIGQLGITVDATGSNKVYDGSTVDAVTLASAGVLSGDAVNFTGSGSFADKNVGTGKTVNVTGIASSGGDAGNYSYNATATTTADVTPATLTYRADTAFFQIGQMPGGLSGAVTGLVGGDTLAEATDGTLTWSTPANAASAAGLYAIDGSGLSALNYLFEQAPGNATALQVAHGNASRVVTTIVAELQQEEISPDDDANIPHTPDVHIVNGGVRLP